METQGWYDYDVEVAEITEGNCCITNSEGEELTSTIFITNKLTIEVTDVFSIRQLFKTLLETELLQRAFKRGVRSDLAHHFTKRQLKELQHNVYRQYLPCGTHTQHIPCGTHDRGLKQHLPCGTAKSESESEDANNAETPVATQQTRAILHSELGDHVPNKVRVFKTAGRNTEMRETFEDNLTSKGQGLANTSLT